MLRTTLVTTFATTAVAVSLVAGGSAQSRRDSTRDSRHSDPLSCTDRNDVRERARHREMREDTIAGANPLDVDAGRNGGISVRGWDRADVLVRTRIAAWADSEAGGPDTGNRDESWSVSFEINVPRTAMLNPAREQRRHLD